MSPASTIPGFIQILEASKLSPDSHDLGIALSALSENPVFAISPSDIAAAKGLQGMRPLVDCSDRAMHDFPLIPVLAELTAAEIEGAHSYLSMHFFPSHMSESIARSFLHEEYDDADLATFPDEVRYRLEEVRSGSKYSKHLVLSAADHCCEYYLGILRSLPGVTHSREHYIWSVWGTVPEIRKAMRWVALDGPGRLASAVTVFRGRE